MGLITLSHNFEGSNDYKWQKIAVEVALFWQLHSPGLHCVIRKLWKDESPEQPEHCAPNSLHTGEGAGGLSTSKHQIS